jgi:hypothetical protein
MKQKKNKTNQVVTWPTATLFTIKELHRLNPKFVEITLRVRLSKAIEAGRIVEIGSIPGEKGRPKKMFSLTPVTKRTLELAREEHINLVDNAEKLVHVMTVSSSTLASSPSVNPVSQLAMAASN